jgi:hypothetical protein
LVEGDGRYRDQHAGRATALAHAPDVAHLRADAVAALLTRETYPARSGKGGALA